MRSRAVMAPLQHGPGSGECDYQRMAADIQAATVGKSADWIFIAVCDSHIICSGLDPQFRSVYAIGHEDQRHGPGAGRSVL